MHERLQLQIVRNAALQRFDFGDRHLAREHDTPCAELVPRPCRGKVTTACLRTDVQLERGARPVHRGEHAEIRNDRGVDAGILQPICIGGQKVDLLVCRKRVDRCIQPLSLRVDKRRGVRDFFK